MEFTHGPWKFMEKGLLVTADETEVVGTFHETERNAKKGKSNRPLIAAAPELFRQLDSLAAALEDGDTIHIEPGSLKAAAIAEAIARVRSAT